MRPSDPGVRLIAYLYYPTEHQPQRHVWSEVNVDTARSQLKCAFREDLRAFQAELWREDILVARLRRPNKPA